MVISPEALRSSTREGVITFGTANVQYFYRDFYRPTGGYYLAPAGPGFGYELDEGKIRS